MMKTFFFWNSELANTRYHINEELDYRQQYLAFCDLSNIHDALVMKTEEEEWVGEQLLVLITRVSHDSVFGVINQIMADANNYHWSHWEWVCVCVCVCVCTHVLCFCTCLYVPNWLQPLSTYRKLLIFLLCKIQSYSSGWQWSFITMVTNKQPLLYLPLLQCLLFPLPPSGRVMAVRWDGAATATGGEWIREWTEVGTGVSEKLFARWRRECVSVHCRQCSRLT